MWQVSPTHLSGNKHYMYLCDKKGHSVRVHKHNSIQVIQMQMPSANLDESQPEDSTYQLGHIY